MLQGTHTSDDASFKQNGKYLLRISRIHDKDVRSTIFIDDNDALNIKTIPNPLESGASNETILIVK